MNFGPHIDPPEVLVHCNLTQVHTPRVSFQSHSNRVHAHWCAVMFVLKRRLEFGTTEEMLRPTLRSTCGGSNAVRLPNWRCWTPNDTLPNAILWPSGVNHYKLIACCFGWRALMALPHWSWRRPIAAVLYLVLFRLISQLKLPLLREEFRLSKFTLHSDLRRWAASRPALPRTSSYRSKMQDWALTSSFFNTAVHKSDKWTKLHITYNFRCDDEQRTSECKNKHEENQYYLHVTNKKPIKLSPLLVFINNINAENKHTFTLVFNWSFSGVVPGYAGPRT